MTRLEKFRITSQQAGVLGVYEAESPETALDALARDAGYTSHAASMSDAIGEADDWTTSPAAFAGGSIGLLVEPATPRAAITIERDGAFYLMALDYTTQLRGGPMTGLEAVKMVRIGNAYGIREALRDAGAKYNGVSKTWTLPAETWERIADIDRRHVAAEIGNKKDRAYAQAWLSATVEEGA